MSADTQHSSEHYAPVHWRTGFWSLIVTQFQGAFSENALKNLVILLILGMGLSEAQKNNLVPIVLVLFALPFVLFSMAGGYLADRFSKRSATIGTKIFEICSTFIALAGLALQNLPLEFVAIFLLSTQAALFGPSKYGLLPEALPEEELSWGNGILELGTFLAIITGTIAAGYMSDGFRGRQQWSGVILIGLAIFGTVSSLGISRVPAADRTRKFQANFVAEIWREMREIKKDRVLWLAVWGNNYFWFLGGLLQPIIILYGKNVLHLSDSHNTYLQGALAIGIGVGSVAAGYLSGGKIEYGLVPLGALGLTVFSITLASSHLTFTGVLVRLAMVGFFGGFFAVPVNALIQHRPEVERRGAVIATAEVLSFVGVGAAGAAYYLLVSVLHLTPAATFLAGSALTLVATIGAVVLLPDSLLRFVLWMATHSLYRIRLEGRANIPERGGALFVANHLSFVDALLLYASTDRHIRFLMDRGIYEHPIIHPCARVLHAIPISQDHLRTPASEAAHALRAGEVVCIAAQGELAPKEHTTEFHDLQREILKSNDVPIVLVNVSGPADSIFRIDGGRATWILPRRILSSVTVTFSPAVPSSDLPNSVREPQPRAAT
jgi:acyl-[acyl-carrier-protein]-phospholipid O-acyltransferase / long-chain-fatty-acid--[acyl-carrier-protein] ligase